MADAMDLKKRKIYFNMDLKKRKIYFNVDNLRSVSIFWTRLIATQILMIFVTQTNTSTMVEHDPQEQMVGIRSYPSGELFSPLLRVCHVSVI